MAIQTLVTGRLQSKGNEFSLEVFGSPSKSLYGERFLNLLQTIGFTGFGLNPDIQCN
jgi:hypothetical protein